MQQPPTQQSQAPQSSQNSSGSTDLRSDAQQIGSTAANRLHSEVDARKSNAATQAKSVSSAIERAAGELDEGAPTWLKSAFQQGAQQIQRFADTIEQKDSRQLLSEAQTFARNNPGTFLAACAAAGFAATRVLKAGGEQQSGQQFDQSSGFDRGSEFQGQQFDQSQPWGDGERSGGAMFQGSSSTPGARTSGQGEFV